MIRKTLLLACVSLTALLLASAHMPQPLIKRMTADLKVRKLTGSKKMEFDAQVCYSANGDMVAHYLPPVEYYILSNKKGNVRIYSPKNNTVRSVDDAFLGSSSSYFYCFVNYRTADMGLKDWGFTLKDSRYEDGHQISEWIPPAHGAARLSKIELVHLNNRILYAGYYDGKTQLFKKVYYGTTQRVKGIEFPTTLTEITYTNVARTDSSIEKSYFSNFAVNEQATHSVCQFQIPGTAKTIKSDAQTK